ncbi:hypothetical protein IWQ60_009917 [Tieghemiomyces parasiticus]|uniref:Uncharacterized protein n=1 Tax=Tieghemiomyces parasiticus TaxID=78921 RepID=A0A9W7ZLF1_9FUNG|nr:hypothetical protein IWQ60_009917 [Tieghemiomyces parasiticus]
MEAQDGDAVAAPATVAPTSSGTANDLASEEPPVKRARTRSKPKRALTPPPPEPKRAVGRPRRSSVTKAAELAAARPAEPARAKRRPSRPRKVPSTTTDPSDGAPSTVSGDTSVLATPSPSETTPILPSPPPPTTESDVLMVAPSEASLPATQTDKATTEPALQSAPAGAQPLPDHNDDDDFSLAGTLSDVPSSSPSALSSPLSTTSPRHSRCRSQDSLSSLDSVRLERIASSRPRSMEHDVPADQIKLDAARDPSPVPEEPVDNSPSEKPAEVAPPPIVTPGTPHEAPTVKEPAVPATDMSADTDNLVTAEPMGPEVSEVNPESPPNSPLVELETKDAQDQGSPPPIKEEGDPGAHADVRAELNPEGNAEGGDGDDEEEEEEEATHHDPAARAKRQDALEVLSQIEVNFAKLREQLYAEKSAELAEELRLLEDEQHPELVEALDRLERRRTKAFKQARHWYDVRTGHNRAMYVSRVYSSHCTYDVELNLTYAHSLSLLFGNTPGPVQHLQESKHKLRKTLLRHCEHQLRLASDEKRHLDQRIFGELTY